MTSFASTSLNDRLRAVLLSACSSVSINHQTASRWSSGIQFLGDVEFADDRFVEDLMNSELVFGVSSINELDRSPTTDPHRHGFSAYTVRLHDDARLVICLDEHQLAGDRVSFVIEFVPAEDVGSGASKVLESIAESRTLRNISTWIDERATSLRTSCAAMARASHLNERQNLHFSALLDRLSRSL